MQLIVFNDLVVLVCLLVEMVVLLVILLKLQWQRLHIHGSVGHSGGIFPYAIRLLAAKRMDILPLVTARFGLDDSIDAIKRAETLQDVKVMVKQ